MIQRRNVKSLKVYNYLNRRNCNGFKTENPYCLF